MPRLIITLTATLCGFGVLAGVASHASAADVRAELTPELIYDHCLAAGVGSEAEATFMLPDGRRVVGSILCAAEDLVAPKATPSSRDHDDDDDEDEDEDGANEM